MGGLRLWYASSFSVSSFGAAPFTYDGLPRNGGCGLTITWTSSRVWHRSPGFANAASGGHTVTGFDIRQCRTSLRGLRLAIRRCRPFATCDTVNPAVVTPAVRNLAPVGRRQRLIYHSLPGRRVVNGAVT